MSESSSASHRFHTLDVFTSTAFGGNQLAVFPDARDIPESALLPITREFNFSEVVFCYPPQNPAHTKRLRIFTPGAEVPFAGHPTVGTAIALHVLGGSTGSADMVLEEGVGPVAVTVRPSGDGAFFAQFSVAKLPEFGAQAPSRGKLADILALDAEDILGAPSAPLGVSCGLPFLIVPLRSVEALGRARLRLEPWESTLKSSWASEVFVFAPDPDTGESHYRARCFVPGLNVPEDPATGSANACLAGYLASRAALKDGTLRWTVDQGVEMGRPSRIEIEADKVAGAITAVRVGGGAVFVTEGTLRLA
jgi:trans-2,3-dihydro-3-hydroxyanthranilate isomerase